MKILVACEESQAVTIELRRLGHEAYSCDIEPCSGGHPEWHLQVDALELLKMKWDMILAFPPCTHLAVSGARYFEQKRKDGRQHDYSGPLAHPGRSLAQLDRASAHSTRSAVQPMLAADQHTC